MESDQNLPFEVGQKAESKSFETGFRGAWFRCEIKDIKMKKGHLTYYLDFYDFTDDKPSETKLYQRPPAGVSREEKKLHLMVRPRFPPIYLEAEMPDMCAISEVVAIVDGVWNVGDLVDWWYDDCYWSGRITHLLSEDKVMLQLPKPPLGEGGGSYEASCKDLRPSLDWSPERGWTVPISLDGEACHCCARLVQPSSPAIHSEPSQGGKSVESLTTTVSSHGSADASASADISSSLPKRTRKLSDIGLVEKTKCLRFIKSPDLGDNVLGNPSSSGSVSSTHVECVSAAAENSTGTKGRFISDQPSKKMCVTEQDFLNSSVPDSIESSLFDLEELVNKIKWIKRGHQFGFACASTMTPSWKFLEDQPSFRHT